jgi:mono/diheme cytochrome c family protein
MLNLATRSIVLSAAFLSLTTTGLLSQQQPAKPKASNAPVELSGKEMFKAYCASCHGEDAKGNGSVAPALKVVPPDLTTLAKRNKGKFPTDYVNNVIVQGVDAPAHGTAEMPVWGPIFVVINDQRQVVLRVGTLSKYLESLQVK